MKMPFAAAFTFVWIGFVCAISFMEAWLKFQAPGITIPLGLGIGRLVFGMLNKIEWILALLILANMFWKLNNVFSLKFTAYYVPILILISQSFYLLPFLDARAEMFIQGTPPPHSNMHFVYIATEVVKVTCLIIFGVQLFAKKFNANV
jgi:hypothetical protein